MKTIEQRAKEADDRLSDLLTIEQTDNMSASDNYILGYKDGFKEATRWIPVEEETPLAYETGGWDGKRSDFVLAKNKWGNVYIARTYEGIIDGSKFCDFAEKDDSIISNIVEWRPIEFD
jgi:hypothetical protein